MWPKKCELDRDKLAKSVRISHTQLDSFILGQYGWKVSFVFLSGSTKNHVGNFLVSLWGILMEKKTKKNYMAVLIRNNVEETKGKGLFTNDGFF